MTAFLEMGGYAAFIWPAYGAALLILGGFTIHAVARYRAALQELAALQARRPGDAR